MKKQIRKITSLFVITALMCQLFSISIFSSGNNNAIGQLNYIIENPYKNVDWDTWGAYKGATHVHSHLSDGSENFHEMVEAYYSAGYDCLSMTDHGTVNYGWTAKKSRHTIFLYQFFVHGEVRPLSEQRNQEITTGVGRDGRGMIDVPLGIELNGASTKKVHVNSYFADCGDGDMELGSTWPESAVVKCQNAGGLCHINHVGEWSGGNDNVNIYDDVFVNDFSNLFLNYSSCIGMELVNTSDNRTRNDRVLYDKTLQITAPQGKNVFGFCEDDAHEFGDIGRNAQIFMMPSNTASNVRTCMETGAFFACSKNAKTPAELGDGFSATGDYPSVTEVEVDEYSDQISFECNNATKMTMVANGEILDTVSISAGTDIVTFDLNEYEDRIGSYVRFYLTGPGGICYVQPFLLTAENNYSVTFNSNGAGDFTPEGGTGATVTYNSLYTLPTNILTKEGYTFEGWRLEQNNTIYPAGGSLIWDIESNATFTAQWSAKTYVVILDPNAGTLSDPSEFTVEYDSSFEFPPNPPERPGYVFMGWLLSNNGEIYGITSTITWVYDSGGTFTAQWEPNTYNVEYVDGLGGSNSYTENAVFNEEYPLCSYVRAGFTRPGYKQIGWSLNGEQYEENDLVKNLTNINGETITFEAVWVQNSYIIVSFDANGGECLTDEKTVTNGETYGSLPIPMRTGYTFGGWFVIRYEDNCITDPSDCITEDMVVDLSADQTLYAYWAVSTYSLIINYNDGSPSLTVTQEYGTSYTVPVPVRTGYTFDGWEFSGDGNWNEADSIYNFSGIDSTTDTLQAQWLINTYNLYINPNGGSINDSSADFTVSQEYGSSYTVPVPVRTGYNFDGWEFIGNGGWNSETNTYTFNDTDDIEDTLIAVWTKAIYIIANEENILIDSDSKFISGFSIGLESLENLLLPATDDCTLDIRNTANGCGTGTVVNVIKNDEIIESYVVVIYGDLDGNSKTDGCDALTAMLIAGGMLSSENVSQAVLMAADANHDGVVNELDAQLLVLAGLFLAEISQTV